MDRRYHPDAKVRLDARALLSAEAYHLPNRLDVLAWLFELGDALFDGGATNLIAANTSAVASSARAVANFDRRQKTFLEGLRKLIGGFVRLFRPSTPVPTREQVTAALKRKQDRYACLDRITIAVHRSQLKEVIDYTLRHPIVHHGRTRNDFTLANAARAVWNTRHAIWENTLGSFETFNQLKAACYNLQQAKDDPFAYQATVR